MPFSVFLVGSLWKSTLSVHGGAVVKGKQADEKPDTGPAADGAELDELVERWGGEASYVRLYRLDLGRKEYVERMGPEGAGDLDAIRDRYGGGEYLIQFCREGGKLLGSTRVRIAALPQQGPTRVEHHGPAERREPQTTQESIAELREIVRELRHPPAAAERTDPLALTASIVEAVSTAAAPLLELVRDMRGGGERGRSDTTELLEAIRLGAELGGGGGGGDWKDQLMGIVAPAISSGGAAGQPTAAGSPPVATPSHTPSPPVGPPATNPPTDAPRWAQAFAGWRAQILHLASENRDPALYADLMLDRAPPEVLQLLAAELDRPDLVTEVVGTWTELAAHREWLTDLLTRAREVLAAMRADGEGDVPDARDAPAGGSGGSGHAPGDVADGARGGGVVREDSA